MKAVKETGLVWLWVAIVIFVIDITSKFYVMNNMVFGWSGRIEVMPFFNLLYAHNYGAAFSFLDNAQFGWQRWFFTSFAFIICGLLIYWSYRLKKQQKLQAIAYSLIIGGAMGNVFDRLYHGFVIDFLDFYYKEHHFATFNIADSAIVIGAILIFLESFIGKKETI